MPPISSEIWSNISSMRPVLSVGFRRKRAGIGDSTACRISHAPLNCGGRGRQLQGAHRRGRGVPPMSLPIHHVISAGPRPVAPFSHAVEADGFVFVTGQMLTDPKAPDAPPPEGGEAQTRRVFENLRIVLTGVGLTLEHVVMARIYLTEFKRDYAALNRIWPAFWTPGKLPARTTEGVSAQAVEALVEIDLVARRP